MTRAVAVMLMLAELSVAKASDADLRGEFSLGYDSNPAQRRDGPSLGFAQLALGLRQPLPQGLSVDGDLWLRDYAGNNDSGRLDLTIAWSQALGKTQFDLWGTGGWYRDQLVPADERNETALGAGLTRALSARFDLALLTERRWLDYRNRELPWAGRPGGMGAGDSGIGGAGLGGLGTSGLRSSSCSVNQGLNADHGYGGQGGCGGGNSGGPGGGPGGGGGAGSGGRPSDLTPQRRADRLDSLALETTWLASPRLHLTLGLDRAWRHSTIALDAYDQQGVRLILGFDPNAVISLSAEAGWSRLDYQQAPQQIERVDHQRGLGVDLRYWLGQGAWFCGLDLLDSRSTVAVEAFTQWVGTCGYQHAF